MKKILRVLLLATLAMAALQAQAHREGVPIINHENMSVVTSSGRTPAAADVAQAIRQAAASAHWEVADAGPDRIVATLVVRGKHTVSTEIRYTAQAYSVKYQSSVNMNYVAGDGAGAIHPNYNRWVQTLVDAIRARVASL